MNAIRDWWHYAEHSPNPDSSFYLALFFGAGLVWLFSYCYIDLPFPSEDERFNNFIRRRRADKEASERLAEKERLREKTWWEKVKAVLLVIYGSAMLLMLLALLIQKLLT